MKHLFTLLMLIAMAATVKANELVEKYDAAVKNLNAQVAEAYNDASLNMTPDQMLNQINSIQESFDEYAELATEIRARFKNEDLQLYADLAAVNPNYCKIEVERNNTYLILGIVDPTLAPLALLDDGDAVFKLKNYGDLMDFKRQLSREAYRIKMERGKPKRYIRKLRLLQEELLF